MTICGLRIYLDKQIEIKCTVFKVIAIVCGYCFTQRYLVVVGVEIASDGGN